MPFDPPQPTTHDVLKKRFKARQVETNNVHQNWQVRVHRSLSWLKRSGELPEDQIDLKFILLWIALNALYGRWDSERNVPAKDDESRRRLIRRLCDTDPESLRAFLQSHKKLIKPVLGNAFLSRGFWSNPEHPDARRIATQDLYHLDGNLRDKRYEKLLDQILDRLYVLRGQLMHGAATGGGKLNRKTLAECLALLAALVPAIIELVIEKACDDEWPDLCYPPIG